MEQFKEVLNQLKEFQSTSRNLVQDFKDMAEAFDIPNTMNFGATTKTTSDFMSEAIHRTIPEQEEEPFYESPKPTRSTCSNEMIMRELRYHRDMLEDLLFMILITVSLVSIGAALYFAHQHAQRRQQQQHQASARSGMPQSFSIPLFMAATASPTINKQVPEVVTVASEAA